MDRGLWHCTGGRDQDYPQGKEMQKGKTKRLFKEALEIAVKREAKGKGEKEIYSHLNAEFQRIANTDKKAFLSDQWKEKRGKQQNGKV